MIKQKQWTKYWRQFSSPKFTSPERKKHMNNNPAQFDDVPLDVICIAGIVSELTALQAAAEVVQKFCEVKEQHCLQHNELLKEQTAAHLETFQHLED